MRTIEFWELTGDPLIEREHLVLKGSCINDGILLGDRFTVAVDPALREFSVCLEVVEIRLYGHLMDEVTRGMGFHLVVTGKELDLISPAMRLFGLAPGRYLHR